MAIGLLVQPAVAQEAGATGKSGAADSSHRLDEIVVTASKRVTDVQKTPLAVTALSNTQLEQRNVVDAVDLNGMVPSLVITTSEGFERNVAIRGIGFNAPQNDAAQPSVSYHVDGIYIANPVALNTGFLDVNHVEVVRGPQGTVYGQNSTGGTLNVVSSLPTTDKINGFGKFDLGNYNLAQFEGAVNLPVGDTFAVRGAVEVVHHDGFAKATQVAGTNGNYGLSDEDSVHARITALWKPTERASLLLRAEVAHARNNNTEGKSLFDPDPNPWHESSDWPGKLHYGNQIYSGIATYDLGFATLKALGSYQTVRQNGSINEDGLDLDLAKQVYSVAGFDSVHDLQYFYHSSKSYTGEVDLASPTGKRLEWIVGAFYLSTRYHVKYDQYQVDQYPVSGDPTSLPNQLFPIVTDPDLVGLSADNGFYYPFFYSDALLTRETYSFYGQATFHINHRLRITGGLRQTHDYNTDDGIDYAYQTFSATSAANALTGKIGIEFDLRPKTMFYANYSTGFKPGGGSISAQNPQGLNGDFVYHLGLTYKPETVSSYEAGLKSTFLDNRVRLNVAAFYYDYKDLQFEAEDGIAYKGGVTNIPSSKVWGFEAESTVLLPANLRLDGSVTVEGSRIASHYEALENVEAYYVDKQVFGLNGPDAIFTDPAVQQQDINARAALYRDVYGNKMPNLPHLTAQASLSHTLNFASGGVLSSSIQAQYRSDYINSVFGNITQVVNGKTYEVYKVPSYVLANLYIGYQFPRSRWEASFVVRNLASAGAVLGQFTNQFGGETTRQYASPRQFVGSISYKF